MLAYRYLVHLVFVSIDCSCVGLLVGYSLAFRSANIEGGYSQTVAKGT